MVFGTLLAVVSPMFGPIQPLIEGAGIILLLFGAMTALRYLDSPPRPAPYIVPEKKENIKRSH